MGHERRGSPVAHGVRRRPSRYWLHAAWVGTIVFLAIAVMAVVKLGHLPAGSEERVSEPASGAPPLRVAIARTPGGPAEWMAWARVVKQVGDRLGRPVELRYLTEEEKAAQVLSEEPADVAFVCPHTYIDLRDAGFVGIASPLIDGSDTSVTMLVVRADSTAHVLRDLRDSVLAVSERTSLGGHAFAQWLAAREGVPLDEMFAEVRVGDTQEDNVRDLLDGTVDATIVNSAQIEPERLGALRVVETSPEWGTPPVIASPDLPEEERDAILDALLGLDVDDLGGSRRLDGFVVLDEADYEFAEELAKACKHHTGEDGR